MKQMKTKTVEVSRDLMYDIMIELGKYHPTTKKHIDSRMSAWRRVHEVVLLKPKPRKWWQRGK